MIANNYQESMDVIVSSLTLQPVVHSSTSDTVQRDEYDSNGWDSLSAKFPHVHVVRRLILQPPITSPDVHASWIKMTSSSLEPLAPSTLVTLRCMIPKEGSR